MIKLVISFLIVQFAVNSFAAANKYESKNPCRRGDVEEAYFPPDQYGNPGHYLCIEAPQGQSLGDKYTTTDRCRAGYVKGQSSNADQYGNPGRTECLNPNSLGLRYKTSGRCAEGYYVDYYEEADGYGSPGYSLCRLGSRRSRDD